MMMSNIEQLFGNLIGLEILEDHAHGLATSHGNTLRIKTIFNPPNFTVHSWGHALKRCNVDLAVILLKDSTRVG